MRTQQYTTTHQHKCWTDALNHIHRISFTKSHSPNRIHRTEIRRSLAGCRGCIGRRRHPETQSDTRTYGTKRNTYVHIQGKTENGGKGCRNENQKNVNHRERGGRNTWRSKMAAKALTQLHGLCYVQKCDSNEPRRGLCTYENM